MSPSASSKHANRSAQTRERFIDAGQALFAEHGVDAVSLNEITVAAGQKNRNALQYHFGNREGLLQAIIDRHASRVHLLRKDYFARASVRDGSAARVAARGLVIPLAEYIADTPQAVFYVKILSQLAAQNHPIVNPATRSGLSFQNEESLAEVMRSAVDHLSREEAQRRLFLTLSMTFHGLADACGAAEAADSSATLRDRGAMLEQVSLAVEALLAAPALESA
jgi:AcrR family transcriptional regulator